MKPAERSSLFGMLRPCGLRPSAGRAVLLLSALAFAFTLGCAPVRGSGTGTDGGLDAGCSSDCPRACRSLTDCDAGVGQAICEALLCQPAGQGSVFALGRAELPFSLAADSAAGVRVRVLAAALPAGGSLDCGGLLAGVDAGTLDPDDPRAVNPLLAAYDVLAHLPSGNLLEFELRAVAGGSGRLLLVEGYVGQDTGPTVAAGCSGYDAVEDADGGPPVVGVQLASW